MVAVTWEQRMAAQSAARREVTERIERAQGDIDYAARWRAEERQAWARVAGMTLGEAAAMLSAWREHGPVACACIGPPFCCRYPYRQAEALVRAAHIIARLLTDVQ